LRILATLSLALGLSFVGGPARGADDTTPAANPPSLTAEQANVAVCPPGYPGARFVQFRGTGFDAWAQSRLDGAVVDGDGNSVVSWRSIWVDPQGRLTLVLNVCQDAYLRRPALDPGDYVISVSAPDSSDWLAATTIAVANAVDLAPTPTATPFPLPVLPTDTATPRPGTPSPTPTVSAAAATSLAGAPATTPQSVATLLAPTATPAARSGLGSQAHPLPLGSAGDLGDGWQITVTGVTPDAWAGSIKDYQPYNKAPADNLQYFMARIQAVYTGQGSSAFSEFRLALTGATSGPYTVLQNSCGAVPAELPPTTVSAGGLVRGNVCWAVRSTDVPSLLLYDSQSAAANRLYFALR